MNHPKLGTPVDVFLTEHPMTKQLEELNSNHLPGMLWKEEGMQTKEGDRLVAPKNFLFGCTTQLAFHRQTCRR